MAKSKTKSGPSPKKSVPASQKAGSPKSAAKSAGLPARAKVVDAMSDRTATLWLTFGVFALYAAFATYDLTLIVNDTYFTAYPAWAIGHNGTLSIDGTPVESGWFVFNDGDPRSDRFPGAIWAAIPFYLAMGTDQFSIAPAALSAAAMSTVAIVVLYRALLRLTSVRTALAAACLTAFGTSMWTVAGDAPWTHSITTAGAAIAMWAMSRNDWWSAGAGYALAIVGRPHMAVVAAVTGIWESIVRRRIAPALRVGAVSAVGLLLLLVWNRVNAGTWTILPGSYEGRLGASTTVPDQELNLAQTQGELWAADILAVLFSPLRGIFVLSPFLLILLPGVRAAWRNAPSWVRSSAVGGLVYLVVQLAGNRWIGGSGFFGYRITIELVFLSVPLLTLAWVHWTSTAQWRRIVMGVLSAVSVWWFAVAAGAFDLAWPMYIDWQQWDVSRMVQLTWPGAPLAGAVFVALLAWLLLPLDDGRRPAIATRVSPDTGPGNDAVDADERPARRFVLGSRRG